ncbi:MAG: tripartite tricarboxylate transporter permease [Planctomycetota bacterium]|nr:tripartite tricarboxylate transporter permease [Planctomycetota bacterium]
MGEMSQVLSSTMLDPIFILLSMLGAFVGICFGAIPGLNTPVAIALALPFTYSLNIPHTLALLMGIFMGGISGGLISAILLKIPGTAAAIATILDGYPMARQGRGAEAMAIGTFASFVGGMFSAVVLMLFSPILSKFALSFGPWEYFGATLLALSLVCTLMEGKVIKGWIATMIGLLLATVGLSPIDGRAFRMTFGNPSLSAGFNLIIVVIGAYAFSEIVNSSGKLGEKQVMAKYEKKFFYFPDMRVMYRQIPNMIRSSIIGTVIGILPGIGATVAGMLSYSQAKRFSRHPEKYGTGIVDGIVASETANNAVTGGALIPMLSLSVPGDPSTAVILGAFLIQGIQCGPLLVLTETALFKTVLVAVFVANIFMFLIQASTIQFTARLLNVPRHLLLPIIVIFCTLGAFSVNNRIFDLYALVFFTLLGYILDDNGYPVMPLVLAFILGPLLEPYFRRTLMAYNGSLWDAFTTRSLGTVMVGIAIAMPILNFLLDEYLTRRNTRAMES